MKRSPGRPIKKDADKVTKVKISLAPKSIEILDGILESRRMLRKGNFSPLINEIIQLYHDIKKYKEIERAKHKEKLELLGGA